MKREATQVWNLTGKNSILMTSERQRSEYRLWLGVARFWIFARRQQPIRGSEKPSSVWFGVKCSNASSGERIVEVNRYAKRWSTTDHSIPLLQRYQSQQSTIHARNDTSADHCPSQTALRACKSPLASHEGMYQTSFPGYHCHCPLVWVLCEGTGSTWRSPWRTGHE